MQENLLQAFLKAEEDGLAQIIKEHFNLNVLSLLARKCHDHLLGQISGLQHANNILSRAARQALNNLAGHCLEV